MVVSQVTLNLPVARKALGLRQSLLELGEHRRREGAGFARGVPDSQERGQAPLFIAGEPCAKGVTVYGQQGGQWAARDRACPLAKR